MSLQVKCAILKRVVYILDYIFFILTGTGIYLLGTTNLKQGIIAFILSGICFIGSYECGFYVNHLIIRMELDKYGKEK